MPRVSKFLFFFQSFFSQTMFLVRKILIKTMQVFEDVDLHSWESSCNVPMRFSNHGCMNLLGKKWGNSFEEEDDTIESVTNPCITSVVPTLKCNVAFSHINTAALSKLYYIIVLYSFYNTAHLFLLLPL